MAALVAVLQAIAATGPVLPVLGILQPREETVPSGAPDLLASPAMAPTSVSHVIGAHVQPRLASGTFSATGGPINAAVDDFSIRIKATGGHAGYPHTTGDPIVAAASIITSLQGLVARGIDPTHPAVITVGSLNAGRSPNVIPSEASLTGTIRSFDSDDRAQLCARLTHLAESLSLAYGCSADVDMTTGEPILVNDQALAKEASEWIAQSTKLGEAEPLRTCGADDFAFYCEALPSLMVFVGVGEPDGPGLHHESFAPSDEAVDAVSAILLASYFAVCSLRLGPPHD
jgi:amidohydrolase